MGKPRDTRGREGKQGTRGKAGDTRESDAAELRRTQPKGTNGEQAEGKQAEGEQAEGYLMPSRERAFWMAASVMLLPLSIWASSVMRSSGVSWRMVLVVPSAVSVFSTL